MDEIKDYINSEFPIWKIKAIFRIGIETLFYDNSYESIEDKINDYDLFYDISLEKEIHNGIFNDIIDKFEITNKYQLREYICMYISVCIPSFKRKWEKYKKLQMLPANLNWYNIN